MGHDITQFVNLASLEDSRVSSMLLDCSPQCLRAVKNVEPGHVEINSSILQIREQLLDYLAILTGPLPQAQNRLVAAGSHAHRDDQMFGFEDSAIQKQGAQVQFLKPAFEQLLQLLTAAGDKVIADGRLLDAIGFGKLLQ